ncbi:hypothetical protein H6F89_08165 [Cyanobacteria bacterium FACHB-63]|nr:hypothetical protein [Cyanobacteria bacterium FACHB-63]
MELWQCDGITSAYVDRQKIRYVPFGMSYEECEKAHHDLVKLLYQRDSKCSRRPPEKER